MLLPRYGRSEFGRLAWADVSRGLYVVDDHFSLVRVGFPPPFPGKPGRSCVAGGGARSEPEKTSRTYTFVKMEVLVVY